MALSSNSSTTNGNTNYYANWDAETWKITFDRTVQSSLKPKSAKEAQVAIRPMVHTSDEDAITNINPKEVLFYTSKFGGYEGNVRYIKHQTEYTEEIPNAL